MRALLGALRGKREPFRATHLTGKEQWALGQEFNCTDLFGSFVFVAADAVFFFVCLSAHSFVLFTYDIKFPLEIYLFKKKTELALINKAN